MDIGKTVREITLEPIPEDVPIQEPSPDVEPVVVPEKEPVGV